MSVAARATPTKVREAPPTKVREEEWEEPTKETRIVEAPIEWRELTKEFEPLLKAIAAREELPTDDRTVAKALAAVPDLVRLINGECMEYLMAQLQLITQQQREIKDLKAKVRGSR